MKEILSIHLGQTGCQIGENQWDLYSTEHGIDASGALSNEYDLNGASTFFHETGNKKYIPRAVFFDSEPSVVDKIKQSSAKKFDSTTFLSGKEDFASNYAIGKYSNGVNYVEFVLDEIRRKLDYVSSPQAIFLYRSLGSGTGGGFGSLLLEKLNELDYKIPVIQFVTLPDPQKSPVVIEPYLRFFKIVLKLIPV